MQKEVTGFGKAVTMFGKAVTGFTKGGNRNERR